jgi:hypothetical protein
MKAIYGSQAQPVQHLVSPRKLSGMQLMRERNGSGMRTTAGTGSGHSLLQRRTLRPRKGQAPVDL